MEAYEFFQELELKISFPALDTGEENKIEESFRYITDFTETEKIFERALEEPVVGIELFEKRADFRLRSGMGRRKNRGIQYFAAGLCDRRLSH